MSMASYDYDVIVIGSGAGGNIAAQQLAKAGKSVAVIEAGTFGGQAPSFGAVPLAALRQAAQVYDSAKRGSRFGIRGTTVGYNYPSIKAWKDLAVKRTGITNSADRFIENGINVIEGRGYFIDPHTITVGSARFSAREFLIATGAEMSLPEIPGLSKAGFLTAREAINLSRPPKSLAIIGAGTTGCELAQLFATFGSKIYLIESAPSILSDHEPEASDLLAKRLEADYSVSVLTGSVIERVEKAGLSRKVTVATGGKKHILTVDEVIVATNNKAATDIGLENAGVAYSDGAILVNGHMQTGAQHIFAAGACTGLFGDTHTAAYQSQVAAHNLLHSKKPFLAEYRAVPRCVFTNPEIASVGLTEKELREQRTSIKSAIAPLSIVAKANTSDYSDGFVKVIMSSKTGVLLGATIVSPQASEMIHELTLAVQYYLTAEQVARTIHIFPTWSEAIKVACAKLARK